MAQSLPPPLPLLLLLLAAGAGAQKLRIGPCPKIHPVSHFNITAYSGLWYENRKLQAIFQLGLKCVTARYSDDLGGFISVTNTGNLLTLPVRAYGYAFATNGSEVGSFSVGFPVPQDPTEPNYNVIEVDYDRYSVVYTCTNQLGNTSHKELLWLLTRQAKFPDREANQIVKNLMRRGIYQAYEMTTTDQFFCPGRDDIFVPDIG